MTPSEDKRLSEIAKDFANLPTLYRQDMVRELMATNVWQHKVARIAAKVGELFSYSLATQFCDMVEAAEIEALDATEIAVEA